MNQENTSIEPDYNLDPIFILGAKQRSGTNFLRNLLVLHPAIGNGCVVWEDFLLVDSDLLKTYAQSSYDRWSSNCTIQESVGSYEVLCEHIGLGLVSFLNLCAAKKGFGHIGSHIKNPDNVRMLATKTPTVKGIGNFYKFFPKAHLIVIVRDGRSVVESGVRSFGWHYETAMREWNEEIQAVIRFNEKAHKEGINNKLMIIRFEDLFTHSSRELERIFSFLGVNAEEYDFHAAEDLPVSGSSDLAYKEKKDVHWAFMKKEKDFNPVERFQFWSRAKHERFNWLTGESLSRFGYNKKSYGNYRHLWVLWNKLMDGFWMVIFSLRSLKRLLVTK